MSAPTWEVELIPGDTYSSDEWLRHTATVGVVKLVIAEFFNGQTPTHHTSVDGMSATLTDMLAALCVAMARQEVLADRSKARGA